MLKRARTKDDFINVAKQFGYEVEFEKPDVFLIRFVIEQGRPEYKRIDIWTRTMTVGAYFNKQQFHARNVSYEDFVEVLADIKFIKKLI